MEDPTFAKICQDDFPDGNFPLPVLSKDVTENKNHLHLYFQAEDVVNEPPALWIARE